MLCLFFAFMLLCYVYFFAFMLLCNIYFLNLCCFCFIVACNPMPACPLNYQRIGIPGGAAAAGTILQSCYRVIEAAVDFRTGAVSICSCCKLC